MNRLRLWPFLIANARLSSVPLRETFVWLSLAIGVHLTAFAGVDFGRVPAGTQVCVSYNWTNLTPGDALVCDKNGCRTNQVEPTRSVTLSSNIGGFSQSMSPSQINGVASAATASSNYCIVPTGVGDVYGTVTETVSPAYNDGSTSGSSTVHVNVVPSSGLYVLPAGKSLDFGYQYVGQSAQATFNIANYNSSAAQITSIATGSSDVTITSGGVGSTIPANGGYAGVDVRFAPISSSNYGGFVTVNTTQGSVQVPYYGVGWLITISTSADGNGTITPSAAVSYGAYFKAYITPNAGYMLSHLTLDGRDVTSAATISQGGYLYTMANIDSSHSLDASFVPGVVPAATQIPAGSGEFMLVFAAALLCAAMIRKSQRNRRPQA